MQNTVVLGGGHWLLPLYRGAFAEHHRIIGVWDTDGHAAERAAADLGTTAYGSVADCLRAKPDLAYVLNVHTEMPDICRQLIAAKIPFVLEKPGAAAVADLAAVRDEADAAGVPATVAVVQRYGPLPDLFGRTGICAMHGSASSPGRPCGTSMPAAVGSSTGRCPAADACTCSACTSPTCCATSPASMPTLTELVEAMRPIEESYV